MRKTIIAALSALALALPVADGVAAIRDSAATAATKKKVVVVKKVVGSAAEADRWGTVQVTLTVRKTTTTVGSKKTVTRRIVAVTATAPDHTPRSAFISSQAVPLLRQEALAAQFSGSIQLISGATDVSQAFSESLQSALIQAKRV